MTASLVPSTRKTPALIGGAIALFLASTLAGLEARRAYVLDPVDKVVGGPAVHWPAPRDAADRDSVLSFLEVAADVDPFDPARGAREEAQSPDVTVDFPATSSRSTLRLIGTVIDPAGQSFVVCQLDGEQPKVVRIGGTIGAYRLTTVRQGSAQFAHDDEGVVTLLVATTDKL